MCGIYGYIGKNSAKETMEGIKRLEYRGYDSAGIAYLEDSSDLKESENIKKYNSLIVIRAKGQIAGLEKIVEQAKPKCELSIGHTRWATHGKPSIENSHPHTSQSGEWALVHNGIIENYLDIKNKLKNTILKSETDTEVVVEYFDEIFDGDPISTLKKLCDSLVGSYAFALISPRYPDKIFVAKKNSPVVVGLDGEGGFVCSDLNSVGKMKHAYLLKNGDISVVSRDEVKIYDKNLNQTHHKDLAGLDRQERGGLGKYAHYMLKEIEEIPRAIKDTVSGYDSFEKLRKALPLKLARKVKKVLIVACGTAYHAGLMGKSLLEEEGIKCQCEIASEMRYNPFIAEKGTLAIFVSQSGETADTIGALKLCKERGLTTLAITNVKNSSITFEADRVIYTNAGTEIGVASTKAYNCQLAIFYLLSAYFKAIKAGDEEIIFSEAQALLNTAQKIEDNNIKALCKKIADEIKDSQSIYMIGRGRDYYLAEEASLKLKEISYIHCEAYPAGELKHGTISLIDDEKFVFAFATCTGVIDKTLNAVNEVASRGGKIILLSQQQCDQKGIFRFVELPKIEERYYPIFTVNYMQLIAYFTSLALGNNPDKPRSLAKSVTVE